MIRVKLPNSSKDDFRKAQAEWEAGRPLKVCGGDVLPKGAEIRKGDLPGEPVNFDPDNDGFGFFLA